MMKKYVAGLALAVSVCGVESTTAAPSPQLIPSEVNGRKIEAFWQGHNKAHGYADMNLRSLFLVQHPVKPREGAPLYVVLHSAGHDVLSCIQCTRQKGNHDIYRAPDDFFALYVDCRANASLDWWWGNQWAERQKSAAFSPCEQRVMDTVEWTIRKYKIDRERVYLCGNSMGGSGTLGIGLRHGDIFAAIKANVPAGVSHALRRLGETAPVKSLPDPPVLIDYSAPNDGWSKGHEKLAQVMQSRKYGWFFFWADFGHANNDQVILEKNDLIHRFDWLSIRLHEPYPVFTAASTDSVVPWPNQLSDKKPGQVNGFFRWKDPQESADGVSMTLFLDQTPSAHFAVPQESVANLTFRRLRHFRVQQGDPLTWTFGTAGGNLEVGTDGLITIPHLTITAQPQRILVKKRDGSTAQ